MYTNHIFLSTKTKKISDIQVCFQSVFIKKNLLHKELSKHLLKVQSVIFLKHFGPIMTHFQNVNSFVIWNIALQWIGLISSYNALLTLFKNTVYIFLSRKLAPPPNWTYLFKTHTELWNRAWGLGAGASQWIVFAAITEYLVGSDGL